MATLSSDASPGPRQPTDVLFRDLVLTRTRPQEKNGMGWGVSMTTHVLSLAALVLVPILWPAELPPVDPVRALLYNPPPPPPPPLPKGSALVERNQPVKPTTPDPKPKTETPKLEVPIVPEEKPVEVKVPEDQQFGSATGSDAGVPEGMDIGVEGGVVGGTPGGVIGGVIGGTGDIPVMDYDTPPRPLKQTKPVYPQEAFVKKIEGTVVVEILIDVRGSVTHARVTQSIPVLDQAAVQCVKQWLFSPAMKHGRPVPTLAYAPVTFRIY